MRTHLPEKLISRYSVWRDSVQQEASGRLQTLYVRGEMVLRAHTIVRVYCCMSGNSYLYHHILNQQPPTILLMFHLS